MQETQILFHVYKRVEILQCLILIFNIYIFPNTKVHFRVP